MPRLRLILPKRHEADISADFRAEKGLPGKGWKLRQLRPDFSYRIGLSMSIELGEGNAAPVEHGGSRNNVIRGPQGQWKHVKHFGNIL